MGSLLITIDYILKFYMDIVIVAAILSWLIAFNVVNTHNRFVAAIDDLLTRLTEPVFAFVRRYLPRMSGLDLSPLVVIFAIILLRLLIERNLPALDAMF